MPFSWAKLAKGGSTEHDLARHEATELARALAAQTIVLESDAVIEELPDRVRAILEIIWPATPFNGYQLQSSLGAYGISKVAWGWAPSKHVALRHEALDRDGLIEDLLELGVARDRADTALGDWQKVELGFTPEAAGLDVSRVAGLAEGALTRRERTRALSQVAFSGRCLSRFASALNALTTLRTVLPQLTPEALGPKVLTGLFAIALQRPDRALELLGEEQGTLSERTVTEIATALHALTQGKTPALADDGALLLPETELGSESSIAPEPTDGGSTDDVLEIVEERVDTASAGGHGAGKRGTGDLPRVTAKRLPRPPRWGTAQPADEGQIEGWAERLKSMQGPLAHRGSLLGLRLPNASSRVVAAPVPPDEAAVRAGRDTFEAVLPPVRGALRAILTALNGKSPSEAALKNAGDLRWVLLRARALARIVEGDLEAACEVVGGLPQGAAPEAIWAQDRLRRYRRNLAARDDEARGLAQVLIADLGQQLGRTWAGTVPER